MATARTPDLELLSSLSCEEVRQPSLNRRQKGHSGSQRSLKASVPRHLSVTSLSSVHETEKTLAQLLSDFKEGKLHAFGSAEALQKMKRIRVMQESLTQKHLAIDSEMLKNAGRGDDGKLGSRLIEITSELKKLTEAIQEVEIPPQQPHASQRRQDQFPAEGLDEVDASRSDLEEVDSDLSPQRRRPAKRHAAASPKKEETVAITVETSAHSRDARTYRSASLSPSLVTEV